MRSPTLTAVCSAILLAVMLACALGDAPAKVAFGPATMLALLTVAAVALPALLWIARPVLYRSVLLAILPFAALTLLGMASVIWSGTSKAAIQNLLVLTAFLSLILASAHCARRMPDYPKRVLGAAAAAGGIALVFYLAITPTGITEPFGISARPFALFALIPAATFLAMGAQRAPWGLPMALVTTAAIGSSLSRTALAIAIALFPVAQLFRLKGGLARFAVWSAIAGGSACLALALSPQLQKRFLEGDTAIQVGGVAINAQGRTVMWQKALESFAESPWIGKGVGSVDALMVATFNRDGVEIISHPHNDYIRLLHDYGSIGLGLWIFGCLFLFHGTWTAWHQAALRQDEEAAVHMAAFLSLVAVLLGMTTDNSLIYIFVMAPLGILLGASLGCREVVCETAHAHAYSPAS